MIRHHLHVALILVSCALLGPSLRGQGGGVQPRFSPDSQTDSPFPSDWFTVPDHTNITHRRVSLPYPDCATHVSDCQDLDVLNDLDGFNLQPRLSVPFSGPIDPGSVTSDTVFLISLGSTGPGQDEMPWGTLVGINQIVWDTLTNTLHVESDALLAQHTRFALIVTRGVRDDRGTAIDANDRFRRFRADLREEYKQALLDAMQAARRVGVNEDAIAVASVFTTQSATAVLEKIHDQIQAASPDPTDFRLGSLGESTVFALDDIANVSWRQQTRTNPDAFSAVPVDFTLVRNRFPGAVGRVAFGKYLSPDYEVHPGEYIPAVATRTGTPVVQGPGMNDIYFNLYLPNGPEPADGWPVVILGHGINGSKNIPAAVNASEGPGAVVGSMAAQGLATIIINSVGNGFGPKGTLTVSPVVGASVTFPAGGRGIDQNHDGRIAANEGSRAAAPRSIALYSDGFRQTAVDLMQLARVIAVGMDVDDDGQRDLDPSRMYYFGASWGGGYGTVFLAVEPSVRAGVIAVPGDPVHFARLGANRAAVGAILASRQPSLLNSPGIAVFDGLSLLSTPPFFDENFPLRDEMPLTVQLTDGTTRIITSPVSNTIVGAMDIQEAGLDRYEWVSQAGSPVAYAPHLRQAPLSGAPAKRVLYLIGKGDETAPNPSTTAILRAGALADRTVYYRHDLARIEIPSLPRNPHSFTGDIEAFGAIALGAQAMAGTFFASDGLVVIHPEPMRFFEVPIVGPLPEGLNFVR